MATRAERASAVDGAFTLAAFFPYGSVSSQFVERNLWSDSRAARETGRIGTTLRRDWAESMTTLEVGDTVSRPGAFGRALRYGGISMGTNFSLRPGFIQQPLPNLSAQASLPSTVEVFVQNQLRTVTQVPAGPFTLDSVPVISGAGDARVVVRDALGRESVVTSSFYGNGLSDPFRGGLGPLHSYCSLWQCDANHRACVRPVEPDGTVGPCALPAFLRGAVSGTLLAG